MNGNVLSIQVLQLLINVMIDKGTCIVGGHLLED